MGTTCDNENCDVELISLGYEPLEAETHKGTRTFCSDGCLSEWQEVEMHADQLYAELDYMHAADDYERNQW